MTNTPTRDILGSTCVGGLDFARFFAVTGMVIMNFEVCGRRRGRSRRRCHRHWCAGHARRRLKVALPRYSWCWPASVLGIADLKDINKVAAVTIRRAVFLLVVGLANALGFEADIIHYY